MKLDLITWIYLFQMIEFNLFFQNDINVLAMKNLLVDVNGFWLQGLYIK